MKRKCYFFANDNDYNMFTSFLKEVTTILIDTKPLLINESINPLKNISEAPLNISPNELTERFVRGDVSRSTEGSGLGLSIAKSLTKLMSGKMIIEIDGDLYKVSLIFPLMEQEEIQ